MKFVMMKFNENKNKKVEFFFVGVSTVFLLMLLCEQNVLFKKVFFESIAVEASRLICGCGCWINGTPSSSLLRTLQPIPLPLQGLPQMV